MPDDQQHIADYQLGFNEGYLIAKHMPALSDSLAKIKSDSPRLEGFRDGRDEFMQEKEKTKQRLPDWLKKDFLKDKESRAPSRDKESREKDKESGD